MKKLISVFVLAIVMIVAFGSQNAFASPYNSEGAPGLKLQTALHQKFPQAGQVHWAQKGDQFIAKFNFGNREVRANFDKKGRLVSTLVSSDAHNLPFEVHEILDKKFSNFVPQCMTECIKPEDHCYYVLLKKQSGNRVNWVRVKIEGNKSIRVIQKLQQTV